MVLKEPHGRIAVLRFWNRAMPPAVENNMSFEKQLLEPLVVVYDDGIKGTLEFRD